MKFSIKVLFLTLLTSNLAFAQTASILPPAKTTFFDSNGNPLVSGTVDFYIPSTTTRKTTWQDAAETVPNTNPVVLDSAGRGLILGSGSYRQVIKDRNGNVIWDQVTSSAGSGGSSSTATGDGDLVGTIKPWAGMTAPNQYMFTYGQEVSRTTYSALFTAITSTQAAFCNSGSPVLNGLSDTTNFWIGMSVEVTCLAAGNSTIISKTATTVTLAANANVTLNTNAVFFPWGRGNGTTTFNIPDFRGFAIAGNNNMGGVANSVLTTAYFGTPTPNAAGAAGGSQSTTLLTANLPPQTPSGTIANGAITNTVTGGIIAGTSASVFASAGGPNLPQGAVAIAVSSSQATSTFTGTAFAGQTSTAFSSIQPTKTSNYIIKVTPDANSATASGVTSLGGMTGDIACGSGLSCTGNNISVNPQTLQINSSIILSGTNKGLLYDNAGVLGNLATANNGVLITDGAGNPSISTIVPSLVTAGNFGFQDGFTSGFVGATSSFLTHSTVLGTLNSTPIGFFTNNILAGSIDGSNQNWTINKGMTINGSGLTINPTANSLNQGINITQSGSGTCPSPGAGPPTAPIFFGCAFNSIFINPQNVNGNGGVVQGLSVQMYNNGTNITNPLTAFFTNYTYGTAPTASVDAVAIGGLSQIDINMGGTGTGAGTAKGAVTAMNLYAIIGGTATNIHGLNGIEINTSARAGTSIYAKNGLSVVATSDDAVQASGPYSVAYSLSSMAGSVNWKCGFCANDLNGQGPITTTGTLFGTIGSATIANAIDVSSYTISGFLLKGANTTISGAGAIITNGGFLAQTSNTNYQANDGTTSSFFGSTTSFLTNSAAIGTLSNHPIALFTNNNLKASLSAAGSWTWNTYAKGPIVSDASGNITSAIGQIPGTATNDSANAGNIGEFFAPTCNNVALTTATDTACTSQSLTAGDWELSAVCYYVPAATTTVTDGTCSFNTAQPTVSSSLGLYARQWWSNNTAVINEPVTIIIPNLRVSLSATTTYYLNANSRFATSTMALYGIMHIRRFR